MPTRPSSFYKPKIDFQDIKRLFFLHAGRVYPVLRSPASVFRSAVLSKAAAWEFHDTYGTVLAQHELDIHDRWWLLNCLEDSKRGIALYNLREAAERMSEASSIFAHFEEISDTL